MSSILSEVLQEKHNATKEEIQDLIVKVESRIISMTTDVNDSLEGCFVMNDSDVDRITAWSLDVRTAKSEAEDLMQRFKIDKELYEASSEEMQDTEERLMIAIRDIRRLHTLVSIVEELETLRITDCALASAKLKHATESLKKLHEELKEENVGEWLTQLEELIEDQVHIVKENVTKEWNLKFKFRKNHLIIEHFGLPVDVMVQSFSNIGHWDAVWNKFLSQLWTEILSKACSTNYSIFVANPPRNQDRNQSVQLDSNTSQTRDSPERDDHLEVGDGADGGNRSTNSSIAAAAVRKDKCVIQVDIAKPQLTSIEAVLHNIFNVIKTIYTIFGNVRNIDLMKRMGAVLGNRLSTSLSTKCLKPLILMNSNGNIENAKQGLKCLTDFIQALYKMGFELPEEGHQNLEAFVANFDLLFAKQLREDIFSKARELIRSEVSKTVRYEPPPTNIEHRRESFLALLKSPFVLEQPMEISAALKELIDILIDHVKRHPEDMAIPANVIPLYLAIVSIPKHDPEAAILTPLQAAVIHNNCWYLAHHASVCFKLCDHYVSPLRSKADQAEAYMMRSMRCKLNALIQAAFSGLDDKVQSGNDISIGFLHVAEELSTLNELFQGVLPPTVWITVLAVLLDHVVNELVNKVLSWDDINAKTASELADAFSKFAIESSYLFKGNASSVKEIDYRVSKYVKKWNRFRLLTFVLTASMVEIGDKWVSGCGPLAMVYTAEEVRKLVRALFQNTDRRAAFLSSIK